MFELEEDGGVIPDMSIFDSPNVLQRPRGTTLDDYICDYTPASGAVPSERNYFEIFYNGLELDIPDREFDITQCRRSPSLPRVHIYINLHYYIVLGLVGNVLICWDREPILAKLWTTFILKWLFPCNGYPSFIDFLYTCFRFTIRFMLQGSDVLDGNTLLLAQEGILYVAAWVISTVKSNSAISGFQFRESRHANVWYAFYMRVLHAPEFEELPRRDEGLLFLLCLYSVLASCPLGGHHIHVFTQSEYLKFHPMVDANRFIAIPPPLGPDEFLFEGTPGVAVLQVPPYIIPPISEDTDVTRRPPLTSFPRTIIITPFGESLTSWTIRMMSAET